MPQREGTEMRSLSWECATTTGMELPAKEYSVKGNATAQYNLGFYYEYGKGVAKDLEKAVEFYTLAANQANAAAQYRLGICYQNGKGVVQDLKKAVEFYTLAANKG